MEQPFLFQTIISNTINLSKPTVYDNLDLDTLRAQCNKCRLCSLGCTRINSVFGRGNTYCPNYMLVGEAPGENEDEDGVPFTGRSGQLLSQILSKASIDEKEECYLTNILKCRPPDNRNPSIEEVELCLPFLIRQVQLIKPKCLVIIGAEAYKAIFGTRKVTISEVRGKWFSSELNGDLIKVMPVFHPAYLLRNTSKERGSPRWLTWQDFKELKEVIK